VYCNAWKDFDPHDLDPHDLDPHDLDPHDLENTLEPPVSLAVMEVA
jgi:hypothetical protein